MSKNMASSDSAEEPNPEDTDQPRDEAEVITSLEYVLAEANRNRIIVVIKSIHLCSSACN